MEMIEQRDIDEINELHEEIMRDWRRHRRILIGLSIWGFALAGIVFGRGIRTAWEGHPIAAFVLFLIAGGDAWVGVHNIKRLREYNADMLEHEVQHRLLMEKWRCYCEWKEERDQI